MIIKRSQHYTDEHLGGNDYKRTISNFCNYQTPSGIWLKSEPELLEVNYLPNDWSGKFEFVHSSEKSPLQVFVGDNTDKLNQALFGVRLSDKPNYWLNIKAYQVNQVNPIIDGHATKFIDLWDNCDLFLTVTRSRVEKLIILKNQNHPDSFNFTIKLSSNHTFDIVDNRLIIKDKDGNAWLNSLPAWGIDADEKPIRVNFVKSMILDNNNSYQAITIIPNKDDLQKATYPVKIDPTTVINTSVAIDDALLNQSGPELNYGGIGGDYGFQVGLGGVGSIRVTIIRISTSSIPIGNYSSFSLFLFRSSNAGESNPGELNFFLISDANTWVEGSSVAAVETGACDWTHAKHNTQTWSGSSGCLTSGTDYDSDASPPSLAYNAYVAGAGYWNEINLKTSWLTFWKNNLRINNGTVCKEKTNGVVGNWFGATSSDSVSNPLYFEIDYNPSMPLVYWKIV